MPDTPLRLSLLFIVFSVCVYLTAVWYTAARRLSQQDNMHVYLCLLHVCHFHLLMLPCFFSLYLDNLMCVLSLLVYFIVILLNYRISK